MCFGQTKDLSLCPSSFTTLRHNVGLSTLPPRRGIHKVTVKVRYCQVDEEIDSYFLARPFCG